MTPEVFRPRELLERLASAQVRFILVGGLAVGAWGHVRGTNDVDLVPDPDPANLQRLAAVLGELGGRVLVEGRSLAPGAITTFLRVGDKTLVRTELGAVDVLQGLPQVPRFEELAAGAVEVDLGGVVVQVCSLEDLRAMKRAAGRPHDLDDLRALEEAHSEDAPAGTG